MKRTCGLFLVILLIFVQCRTAYYQTQAPDFENQSVNKINEIDSSVWQMIQPFKQQLDTEMDRVLAYNPELLNKSELNSNIGRWMAQALLNESRKLSTKPIDFCLLNRGGIRTVINPGPVTVRNIFEVMPFDNQLVVLELDSVGMKGLMAYMSENWIGHPLAELQLEKQANSVKIVGDRKTVYRVVTSDYVANGGDGMTFFSKSMERVELKVKIRDVLIGALQKTDTIRVPQVQNYIELNP